MTDIIIEEFIIDAADACNITIYDLIKSRKMECIDTRYVMIYIINKCFVLSLSKIGRYFNKHHSTIIHAVKTVEDRLVTEIRHYNSLLILLTKILNKILDKQI